MIIFSKDSVVLRVHKNAQKYSIEKETEIAILEKKKHLLDLNRSQLRIGVDAEGKKFGDYKSENYAKWKKTLNSYYARSPTPDLYVTGELQQKMDLDISGNNVIIDSKDPMSDEKLKGRFGNAFGINNKIKPFGRRLVTSNFIKNTYKLLFK